MILPGARRRIGALLGVLLAEALRRGRSGEGIEVRPLRQVLFASTLLGVMLAAPLRHESATYHVQVLFLYAALYTALAVVPDPQDVFERRRDLLGPLPLRPVEAALARIAFLGLLVTLLVVPLALPSLLWRGLRGELGPAQVAGCVPGLVALCLTVAGGWLYVAFRLGGWLGVDRLRKVASLSMSLLIAGSSLIGSLELWAESPLPPGAGADLLPRLPTSWYAAPALAPAAPASWAAAAGALLLLAVALLLASRTDPTRAYTAAGRRQRTERDGWVARLLAVVDRRRSAAADRRALPLLLFLSRVWSRDAFTSLRVRAFAASALVLLAVEWFWRPGTFAMPLTVASLGFMAIADGALDLATSSEPDAAWLLDTAPVGSAQLVAAMRAVVLAERGAVAAVALAGVTAIESGPTAGAAVALAFLAVGHLLVSALLLVRPRRPFAQQASAARGTTAIWVASPLALAGVLALLPALLAAPRLPAGVDLLVCGVLAATLYAFGRAFGVVAAARHTRLATAG